MTDMDRCLGFLRRYRGWLAVQPAEGLTESRSRPLVSEELRCTRYGPYCGNLGPSDERRLRKLRSPTIGSATSQKSRKQRSSSWTHLNRSHVNKREFGAAINALLYERHQLLIERRCVIRVLLVVVDSR